MADSHEASFYSPFEGSLCRFVDATVVSPLPSYRGCREISPDDIDLCKFLAAEGALRQTEANTYEVRSSSSSSAK